MAEAALSPIDDETGADYRSRERAAKAVASAVTAFVGRLLRLQTKINYQHHAAEFGSRAPRLDPRL